jgi:hypothetical protein
MEKVNQVRRASVTALRACAVAAAMIAASIAMPASAESTTPPVAKKTAAPPTARSTTTVRSTKEAKLPVQPAKPYLSPYTQAAMAQHSRAAHLSTGSAPTAMQAAGKPSRAHAPAKR